MERHGLLSERLEGIERLLINQRYIHESLLPFDTLCLQAKNAWLASNREKREKKDAGLNAKSTKRSSRALVGSEDDDVEKDLQRALSKLHTFSSGGASDAFTVIKGGGGGGGGFNFAHSSSTRFASAAIVSSDSPSSMLDAFDAPPSKPMNKVGGFNFALSSSSKSSVDPFAAAEGNSIFDSFDAPPSKSISKVGGFNFALSSSSKSSTSSSVDPFAAESNSIFDSFDAPPSKPSIGAKKAH